MWIGLLSLFLVVPAYAAEPGENEEEAEPVVEETPMTQGELAVAIVIMLGLESEIDNHAGAKATLLLRPNGSELIHADFLSGRGVRPLEGWEINEEVTNEVLAVVVVQVLGLVWDVGNRDDPDDYIAVLEARDLILTSVRDVLSELEAINPVVHIPLAGLYQNNLSAIRGF